MPQKSTRARALSKRRDVVQRPSREQAEDAVRVLLRWAFDTLDLNRVQAETDTRNVASARVLEKLGFAPCYHMRNVLMDLEKELPLWVSKWNTPWDPRLPTEP